MTDKQIKKYCDGLDCAICNEKEPCIYKIANELEEKLQAKEQECKELKNKLAKSFTDERKKEIQIDLLKAIDKRHQNEWQEAVEEKLIIQSQNDELEIKNINLTEQLTNSKKKMKI